MRPRSLPLLLARLVRNARRLVFAAWIAVAGLSGLAEAQSSPRVTRRPPPGDVRHKESDDQHLPAGLVARWSAANEKDRRPRVMLMVGVDRRPFQLLIDEARARESGADVRIRSTVATNGYATVGQTDVDIRNNGSTARDRQASHFDPPSGVTGVPNSGGVGADLSRFDPSGIAEQFASEIAGHIDDDPLTEIVDLQATQTLLSNNADALAANDDEAAIELVSRQLNAELVIYVKLQPVAPDRSAPDEPRYKGIGRIVDMRRGNSYGHVSFDWIGDDVAQLRINGTQTAVKLMEAYVTFVEAGGYSTYRVNVLGLGGPKDVVKVQKAFATIDGVRRVTPRLQQRNADRETNTPIDVVYPGSNFELAAAVEEKLAELGLGSEAKDVKPGMLIYRVGTTSPEVAAPRPASQIDWLTLTDASQTGHAQVVEEIRARYAAMGNPKVCVIVNWLVRPNQVGWPDRPDNVVVMGGDPRIENQLQGPVVQSMRAMEAELGKALRTMGIETYDAQSLLKLNQAKARQLKAIGQPAEQIELLRSMEGYDVLIFATADITDPAAQGDPTRVRFSFELVQRDNARELASQNWTGVEGEREKRQPDPTRTVDVGRYVAASLVKEWILSGPGADSNRTLSVLIVGNPSQAQVQQLLKLLTERIPNLTGGDDVAFNRGTGTGSFTLRFNGSAKDLQRKLEPILGQLDLQLEVVQASSDTLTLRMK